MPHNPVAAVSDDGWGEQVEGHDPSWGRGSRSGVFCWKTAGFPQDPEIGRTADSYNFVEITGCDYEAVKAAARPTVSII